MATQAQDMKFPGLDASPADIALYSSQGDSKVKVVYSRPQKKGRAVFGGELVPYGKVWRTGANEATTITFHQDVMFGDNYVPAGTYALFTQPGEDVWQVMLNGQANQWGAYNMDPAKTVATTQGLVSELDEVVEAFAITYKEVEGGVHLVMAWDQTMVEVPIMME
jgi:hypothetical protein